MALNAFQRCMRTKLRGKRGTKTSFKAAVRACKGAGSRRRRTTRRRRR